MKLEMSIPKETNADVLLVNAAEVLTCEPVGSDLVGRIKDGAVAIKGEKILAVGETKEIIREFGGGKVKIIDVTGKVLAPGFVDCHTHVVFGGTRVLEYTAKLTKTKSEVNALGIPSGILASVAMTRAEDAKTLTTSAYVRVQGMLQHGTTTVESKSGYGLDLENELKLLHVNQKLNELTPVDIVSTFLGAHAFPPNKTKDGYVREVIEDMLPEVARQKLAEFCDVYIDDGYFDLAQTRDILVVAKKLGLKLKIHADQYSAMGGSELAAELGVVSADHLNYTNETTFKKLADAGVVGVVMPVIDFAVGHPIPVQVRKMLKSGMEIALATDLCPGGWTESMQLVIQFSCKNYGISPEEALLAGTVGGAKALDLEDRGKLVPGMLADIQIWRIPVIEDLVYRLGNNAVDCVIKRGKIVYSQAGGKKL